MSETRTVVVVGATGYTGAETLRWVLAHPRLELVGAVARSAAGQPLSALWPSLGSDRVVTDTIPDADVALLCLPHGGAAQMAPGLPHKLIVDLSGDHRLPEPVHSAHYGFARETPPWRYGLPELGEARMHGATRIANPGCFATALALALLPVAAHLPPRLAITGLTGSTGSGVKPATGTHHPRRNENLRAYKVLGHQHVPEVEAALGGGVRLDFVPLSAPVRRGILVSAVLPPLPRRLWEEAYAGNPLLRVLDRSPELLEVLGSPRADVGVIETPDATAVFCAIDNLGRGAGSQAVSNVNLALGWPVDLGLRSPPPVV